MKIDTDVIPEFALSIKQPWATLVLLGLKTIEIRRWSTPIRGRIYIHAGKIPDERLEGWSRVPEEHFALTARRGGILGTIEIVECLTYSSLRQFARDRQLHHNDPNWFLPPRMFGFRFAEPKVAAFRSFPGQVKLFPVPPIEGKRPKPAIKRRVSFELGPTHSRRSRAQ